MCITIYALTVVFLKFSMECFIPRKNCPAAFLQGYLRDQLLNKLSYPALLSPVGFVPPETIWCSFLTPDSFILSCFTAYN